jgi:hypothetical protein
MADRMSKHLCLRHRVPTYFVILTAAISWGVVQQQIPAVDFVHKYEHVFALKYVLKL